MGENAKYSEIRQPGMAPQHSYLIALIFHDCEAIRMKKFSRQNAVYDLRFE